MKKVLACLGLIFSLAALPAHAEDAASCQNYFGRFSAATPHDALKDSAYYLEYSKLGSLFLVQREGLPFYAPHWRYGVFLHTYGPVTLTAGGGLQASPGSFSSFRRGDMLALAEAKQTPFEARFRFISYDKFVVKPDSDKKTDRVTLELVVPSEGNWCTAKRNFETWLKGFGGMLELERYQKVGESPATPPAAEAAAPSKKEKKAKVEEPAVQPMPREELTPPAAAAPAPKKESPAPAPEPKKEAAAPAPAPKPAASKEMSFKTGMSRSEVDSMLGSPVQVMKLGDKSICYYDDVIIEFEKDKLSSIRLSDRPTGEVLKRYH